MLAPDWPNLNPSEGRTVTITPREVFVVEIDVFAGQSRGGHRSSVYAKIVVMNHNHTAVRVRVVEMHAHIYSTRIPYFICYSAFIRCSFFHLHNYFHQGLATLPSSNRKPSAQFVRRGIDNRECTCTLSSTRVSAVHC